MTLELLLIATSTAEDFSSLRHYLPRSISMARLENMLTAPKPDLLLLDTAHPAISTAEIVNQLAAWPSVPIAILASRVEAMEGLPIKETQVTRVFKHPTQEKEFKSLAEKIMRLADPDAGKKFAEIKYNSSNRSLSVLLQNGKAFRLPLKTIEGCDDSEPSVKVIEPGHEIEIRQKSGNMVIVPWDLVLYHCDPGYKYYKRKHSPTLAEKVAANIKRIRAAKGMTSYALALKTGIERANIARIENAKTAPSLHTLDRLAQALEVPAVNLLE